METDSAASTPTAPTEKAKTASGERRRREPSWIILVVIALAFTLLGGLLGFCISSSLKAGEGEKNEEAPSFKAGAYNLENVAPSVAVLDAGDTNYKLAVSDYGFSAMVEGDSLKVEYDADFFQGLGFDAPGGGTQSFTTKLDHGVKELALGGLGTDFSSRALVLLYSDGSIGYLRYSDIFNNGDKRPYSADGIVEVDHLVQARAGNFQTVLGYKADGTMVDIVDDVI